MGRTSSEVKQRWNNKTYKRVVVSFRLDEDRDLLQFLEEHKDVAGTTQLFREALELYIKAYYPDWK